MEEWDTQNGNKETRTSFSHSKHLVPMQGFVAHGVMSWVQGFASLPFRSLICGSFCGGDCETWVVIGGMLKVGIVTSGLHRLEFERLL